MKRLAQALLLAAAFALGGCASVPADGAAPTAAAPVAAANPVDPWENWNRKVVPQLVRTGIGNVFGNIGDVWSAANHLLQGKLFSGLDMGMRVLTNTFFGLGGLLDPATEMGLTRRSEDFGQTLGRWGAPPGPYIVLPFLGPSNVRDTGGFIVDRASWSASQWATDDAVSYSITALQLVDTRANLLATTRLVGEVALDRYSFIRDGYLARRLDQVYDGAPPLEVFEDEADPAPPKK